MTTYARAPGMPLCEHGAGCYRKNPQHFKDFDHPADHPLMPPRIRPVVVDAPSEPDAKRPRTAADDDTDVDDDVPAPTPRGNGEWYYDGAHTLNEASGLDARHCDRDLCEHTDANCRRNRKIAAVTDECTAHPDTNSYVKRVPDQIASFVAIGDFGRDGFCCQLDVAKEMSYAATKLGVQSVINLGDAFYERGLQDHTDVQVRTSFRPAIRPCKQIGNDLI